jgi:hypothetical protein
MQKYIKVESQNFMERALGIWEDNINTCNTKIGLRQPAYWTDAVQNRVQWCHHNEADGLSEYLTRRNFLGLITIN